MERKSSLNDATISRNCTRALAGIGLRTPCHFDVQCRNGEVTLTGMVQYDHQRNAAVQGLRTLEGVRRIIEKLKVMPAPKRAFTPPPPARQPAVEQPAVEQPAVEQPAVEQPAVEQAAVEQPAVEQPAVEQPAVEQPAVEQPAAEQPVAEQPSAVPAEAAAEREMPVESVSSQEAPIDATVASTTEVLATSGAAADFWFRIDIMSE